MTQEPNLEIELESRIASDPVAADFWHRYKSVKSYLEKEYYPWIQANSPFLTDHGDQHIRSVLRAASLLLSEQLGTAKGELKAIDIYLILSGILWHDVGNVYGRTEHADRVTEMTKKVAELAFPDPGIQRLVEEISKAHSGNDGLQRVRLDEDWRSYSVYPRALAAIVRFADEISEDRSRISLALLKDVPNANRIYWEYANCISSSRPDIPRKRVVLSIEMECMKILLKHSCAQFKDRLDANGTMSLLEYVLSRLEKMNNERAYCSREFGRYLSIREITARFTLLKGTERLPDYELSAVTFGDSGLNREDFPQIPIFADFFATYPSWLPDKLKEVAN